MSDIHKKSEPIPDNNFILDNNDNLTTNDRINIILQFYRGEIARSNTYRRMVDSPSNWAILLSTFTLSLYLSLPDSPWFTPLIIIPVLFFLLTEMCKMFYAAILGQDRWNFQLEGGSRRHKSIF